MLAGKQTLKPTKLHARLGADNTHQFVSDAHPVAAVVLVELPWRVLEVRGITGLHAEWRVIRTTKLHAKFGVISTNLRVPDARQNAFVVEAMNE
jgi:hypothetical protein